MKNIRINYWLICLVFVTLFSCNNDEGEELFADSPAERIADRNSELSGLLLAEPNGYKGVYFTKNDEFGGFTFFMKFNDDGTVDMTSDFDSDLDVISSSYEVRYGTTNELVFTTRNHIQKVSNPDQEGAIGYGYKGTSVFQYFGNENGVLSFRDVRNRDTGYFVFTPTDFSDFETESVASAEKSLNSRSYFSISENATAFPFLSVNSGGNLDEYALNYNDVTLFANPTKANEDGSVSDEKFGIAFTEEGLIISPALNINGILIDTFILDETDGQNYIATIGDTIVTIGYGNTPLTPLDAYDFGVRRSQAWFNDYEMFKSSVAYHNLYNDITASLFSTYGITVNFAVFYNLNNGGDPALIIGTDIGNIWVGIDIDVTDGIVVFTENGNPAPSAIIGAIFRPLIDLYIGGPEGFYLKNTDNLLQYSNRTFSMINVADPRITINFYDQ